MLKKRKKTIKTNTGKKRKSEIKENVEFRFWSKKNFPRLFKEC